MQDSYIIVDALHEIRLDELTPQLGRESGFRSVVDLLVAKHCRGMHGYLVKFHFVAELPTQDRVHARQQNTPD